MYVAKTKALIIFVVTAKLICVFVFPYVKPWFSHDVAHFKSMTKDHSMEYTAKNKFIVCLSVCMACMCRLILIFVVC